MTPDQHRRARRDWAIAAPVIFVAAVLLRIGAPHIAPYIVSPSSWLLAVVFAAYHHGWLRRDKETDRDPR